MTTRIPESFSVEIVDAAGYTPKNAAVAFDRETRGVFAPSKADGDYKDESPELDTVLQVQAGRIIARVSIEDQLFNAFDTAASRSFVSE